MIKAIFFDLGGVVLKHGFEAVAEYLAKPFGITSQEARKLLDQIEEDWRKGKADLEGVVDSFQKALATNLPKKQIIDIWFKSHQDKVEFNDDVIELIEKLRKKYKVYLLSNTVDLHYEAIDSKKELAKYFDNIFISSKIGLLKPGAEIYEHVLVQIGAKPQDCIFVDDKVENVEGAQKVGMKGILFTNYQDLLAEFKKLGVYTADSI